MSPTYATVNAVLSLAEEQGWRRQNSDLRCEQYTFVKAHRQLIVRFSRRGGITAVWTVDPRMKPMSGYFGGRTVGKWERVCDWLRAPST